MIQTKTESRLRELLLAFAAGATLMCAALANFLVHNDYSMVGPDVAIVLVVMLMLAAAMAPFYVAQRQWGRSLLIGLLVLAFADFNGVSPLYSVLAGLGVGLFTWWTRISLTGPLALFGAVILATTLAGVAGRPTWLSTVVRPVDSAVQATPPDFAVLHVLLDEQAGVHGIYPDANGLRLRRELRDFFLSRGFALYGRAYTEHMHTVNAIPAVLNFGTRLASSASQNGVRVGKTAYFDRLHRQGFKIHVLQSDFADLCAENPVSVCTTYDSSSLRPLLDAPLSTAERAQLVGLKFVALSKIVREISRRANQVSVLAGKYGWPIFEPGNLSRTSTVAAIVALRDWSAQLRRASAGEVYFAHVLLPHYPHVVRADCSYLPWKDWELRRSNTPVERRHQTFAEQDRCTLRKLDELIRAFETSPGGRTGAIIFHGDHGSRIVRRAPVTDFVGQFSDADVVAAHATLFAVRARRSEARYHEMPQPTPALLSAFVSTNFQNAPEPDRTRMRGYIMSDKFWRPQRRAELPRNW